jgi:hypothetical protein
MSKSFINLSTEQAVISAIPALMRFVVTNSVIAIMFSPSDEPRNDLRCAIRFNVTVSREQAQRFALTCHLTAEENSGAILVAICDPEHDEHALDILEDTRTALHDQGIPVLQMLTTHSLTAAGRWINPDTGEDGPTIPYTDAAITAEVILEGSAIERSRDAIEAEFTLTDAAPYIAVEGDFDDLVRRTVAELRALITGSADAPADDLATRAAIIITENVHLRDALLRIGLGHEQATAQMWTALAAQLRGHARAHVLTVAAFNYYLAADAVRAGIAIDHIADTVTAAHLPMPNLADLLNAALRAGMNPAKLHQIVPTREQAPIPGTDL